MWPECVVVASPVLDCVSGVVQVREPFQIQALITHLTVEGLDDAIFRGLTGFDEVQLDLVFMCSLVQGPSGELWPIVHLDDLRFAARLKQTLKNASDTLPAHPRIDFNSQRLSTKTVHYVQSPKGAITAERVMNKVHRPHLVDGSWGRWFDAKGARHMLPLAGAQLEVLFSVQAQHSLRVDLVPFAA